MLTNKEVGKLSKQANDLGHCSVAQGTHFLHRPLAHDP